MSYGRAAPSSRVGNLPRSPISASHPVLFSTPPDQYHDIVEITNQPAVQINVGSLG